MFLLLFAEMSWLLCGCCQRKDVEDVRELDYSHCSLTVVPSDVFQFERTLEELSLNSNQITQLPKVSVDRYLLSYHQRYSLTNMCSPWKLTEITH